jgi:hypothetical protein
MVVVAAMMTQKKTMSHKSSTIQRVEQNLIVADGARIENLANNQMIAGSRSTVTRYRVDS